MYVKSRKTGNYVNAHDICHWDSQYSVFQELVDGRNYEVFSLFGSQRADYHELAYGNYGIPDFLKDTIFEDYCRECGYYGFVWFKLPDLKKAVTEYIEQLNDPFKYLDHDSDEYAGWVELWDKVCSSENGASEFIVKYREWLDMHRNVLENLQKMADRLGEYSVDRHSVYDKVIDVNETIFLFFFDS